MKQITVIIASLVILASVSCKEQKEEPIVIEKTETIVIEKETPPKEENGTSLSIDNDGVEFSTKDGDKKTEVKIETEK